MIYFFIYLFTYLIISKHFKMTIISTKYQIIALFVDLSNHENKIKIWEKKYFYQCLIIIALKVWY